MIPNFYLDGKADGRLTAIQGGTKKQRDGMVVVLYQRHKGQLRPVVRITCLSMEGDQLESIVQQFQTGDHPGEENQITVRSMR